MKGHILVALGTDPALKVDLAAFRAIRDQTGLSFTRLEPTYFEFVRHLRRIRIEYEQMPYVHLSMHMGANGAQFKDGVVSPEQLSAVLSGVPVLFLDGCESTAIGDLLGNVPYVLTLLEEIDHESARLFAQQFWLAVGKGNSIEDAYDAARDDLPDVGEYAYLHRNGPFLAKARP